MKFEFEKIFPALNKLTKAQKKIIEISSLALLALAVFWFLVYLPQSRKLATLKQQLSSIEGEIAAIQIIAKDRELGTVVKDLKTELGQLNRKFAPDDQAVVYQLSESAKKAGIEVKNIDPQDKSSAGTAAGLNIEELPVALELSCDYRALGEYLDFLQDEFVYLAKIKDVSMSGHGRGNPRLDVTVHISVYLGK
jgi:hypothetical protein